MVLSANIVHAIAPIAIPLGAWPANMISQRETERVDPGRHYPHEEAVREKGDHSMGTEIDKLMHPPTKDKK